MMRKGQTSSLSSNAEPITRVGKQRGDSLELIFVWHQGSSVLLYALSRY